MIQAQAIRFVDTLKRLLRRNATPNLKNILARTHPADIAQVLDSFLPREQIRLVGSVGDLDRQAEVIAWLPVARAAELLGQMELARSAELLSEMSGDDRADVLAVMDEDLVTKLLAEMPDEESDEATELMRYDESTAGGIMSPDVLAIAGEVTVREAIRIVQESPDVEMAFYIYVVNVHHSLVGVLSLRQLVTSGPDLALKDIMNPQVVSVTTDEDQEEVARIVSRYDLLAVPVVDHTNRLVGAVTVDDVIDVLREEATEDMLKMAGAGQQLDDRPSVIGTARRRAPWLAAACAGGVLASFIIERYEGMLERYVVLATFIPVIIGMAGNVGTQSLTTVVRALATRRIQVSDFWRVAGSEILVGTLLGLTYGAILGGIGFVQVGHGDTQASLSMALVIGGAALGSMTIAAAVATAMPLFFARLQVDPAIATGPFVTTAIDVIGVAIYFNIATALL